MECKVFNETHVCDGSVVYDRQKEKIQIQLERSMKKG